MTFEIVVVIEIAEIVEVDELRTAGLVQHDLVGGHIDSKFDELWLTLIETEPEKLANMSHFEIMKNAGAEAVELIMWLVMRGAMAPAVKKTHVSYYAPMTTGMGLIALVDL